MRERRTREHAADRVRRHGTRVARLAEGLANEPVRVEVHLPVVLVAAVRTHAQQRTGRRELQHVDVRRRRRQHVRNAAETMLDQTNGVAVIHGVADRCREIHATLSKYLGNWMFTGKVYHVPAERDLDSTSYHGGFRRYFGGDGTSYTGLTYSHGISREIRSVEDLTTLNGDTVPRRVRRALR